MDEDVSTLVQTPTGDVTHPRDAGATVHGRGTPRGYPGWVGLEMG